ncbi:MAG: AMP-binding protein [Acidimicrobiales bacterium]
MWAGENGRHPGVHALLRPQHPAVVMAGSEHVLTYFAFESLSARIARVFRQQGLRAGGRVVLALGNEPAFLPIAWAAQRAGLRYTPLPPHSSAEEAAYVIGDSEAEVVVVGDTADATLDGLSASSIPSVREWFTAGEGRRTLASWPDLLAEAESMSDGPVEDESEGDAMLYSSGTTGRPKGVKRPLSLAPLGHGPDGAAVFLDPIGVDCDSVLLLTGPLYHGAGLSWALSALRRGATVVVLERFDTLEALAALGRHEVTHSQWVPTMFVRMLQDTAGGRERWRFPAHRAAVHGAGPCPIHVKREMLAWWGPILWEYYSCTEGIGATLIDSSEWQQRPGSVGRPVLGRIVIRGDAGEELPADSVGNVWFSGGFGYAYAGDRKKTEAARNRFGEATVGDIGYVDVDGYLYLTGRKAHTVVSGGVNIYPREIEECIAGHPDVADVAVLGVPDEDLGERLVAVVETRAGAHDVASTVLAHCRALLIRHKVPRQVVVVDRLPREATGKLRASKLASLVSPSGEGAGTSS